LSLAPRRRRGPPAGIARRLIDAHRARMSSRNRHILRVPRRVAPPSDS